jgi:hypothetical protein
MAVISFPCPHCQAILKTTNPQSAGRMFRCPRCNDRFAMPTAEECEAQSAERKRAEATRGAATVEPTADVAVRDAAEPAARPARRRMVVASVVLGAFALLLTLAGSAYYAWDRLGTPGRNAGSGNENPLAFLPGDSTIVVRINAASLVLDEPALRGVMEGHVAALGDGPNPLFLDCKGTTGLEFEDFFYQLTYGVHIGPSLAEPRPEASHMTLVIRSRVPFSQKQVARAFPGAVPQEMSGKTYYRINDRHYQPHFRIFRTLYMPSDRTVVLTNMPRPNLAPMLQADGTQLAFGPDLQALFRECDRGHYWAVVPFDATNLEELQRRARQSTSGPAIVPAGTRAAAVWTGLSEGRRWVRAGLACPDNESAAGAALAFNTLTPILRASPAHADRVIDSFPAALIPPARDLLHNGKCETQGKLAFAEAPGSVDAVLTLVRDLPLNLPIHGNAGRMGRAMMPPPPVSEETTP